VTVSAQQEHLAYVLEVRGTWSISGSTEKLSQWQSVPAGVRIVRLQSDNPSNDKITLLYRDKTISPPCIYPCEGLVVRSSLATTSVIDRIKDAGLKLMEATISGLSRDSGSLGRLAARGSGLQDSVVRFEGTTIHLGPALTHAEPGRYVLRLSRIKPPATAGPLESSSFDWRKGQAGLVEVSGLTPGLYECRLSVRRYGQLDDTGQRAWVLLADTARYDEASASFAEVVSLTEQWNPRVDDETIRQFLRAALDHVASSVATY
jgi:hypothetical protein